jgi:hypothetical protein
MPVRPSAGVMLSRTSLRVFRSSRSGIDRLAMMSIEPLSRPAFAAELSGMKLTRTLSTRAFLAPV